MRISPVNFNNVVQKNINKNSSTSFNLIQQNNDVFFTSKKKDKIHSDAELYRQKGLMIIQDSEKIIAKTEEKRKEAREIAKQWAKDGFPTSQRNGVLLREFLSKGDRLLYCIETIDDKAARIIQYRKDGSVDNIIDMHGDSRDKYQYTGDRYSNRIKSCEFGIVDFETAAHKITTTINKRYNFSTYIGKGINIELDSYKEGVTILSTYNPKKDITRNEITALFAYEFKDDNWQDRMPAVCIKNYSSNKNAKHRQEVFKYAGNGDFYRYKAPGIFAQEKDPNEEFKISIGW